MVGRQAHIPPLEELILKVASPVGDLQEDLLQDVLLKDVGKTGTK